MIKYIFSPAFLVISYAMFFYVFGMKGILWLAIGTLVIAVIVIVRQDKLVYMTGVPTMPQYPEDNIFGLRHPSEMSLRWEDIQISTNDGVKLKGWHLYSEGQAKRLVVYFHDNAGNIGLKLPFLRNLLQRTNSNVIIVAYRGYSHSTGTPSEEGLKTDARAILNFAIEQQKKLKIKSLFVYGRSLGGAVTIYACSDIHFFGKIDGLLLENTFTSLADVLDTLLPVLRLFKFLQKNHWRSIDLIGTLPHPIYFIKSLRDQIVDVSHMNRLQQKAISSSLIDQLRIMNGTHNNSWQGNPDQFFIHVLTFFQRVENIQRKKD